MKTLISNPNFIYIASFSVPFIFYSLEWSTLYPPLSHALFLFYLFTFLVCFVPGIVLSYARPFTYTAIGESAGNLQILGCIYLLYLVEIFYSGEIPLLGLFRGTFQYSEDSFGIPVLHTFLVSFNTFYGIYLFHQYLSVKRKSLLWLFFLSIFPFVILVYRSNILSILLGAFFVFLFSRERISVKTILGSLAGVVIVLFLFGFIGNIRSGKGDPTFIPKASGATEEFLNSRIPKEFYWSYLYIASPVANLQNNINYTEKPGGSFEQLVLNECVPGFILKFLPFLQVPSPGFYQINPFLNVGTTYVYSFSYLRWKGVIFFFLYFIILVNLYYLFILQSETYKVTGLAILLNIIVFANFHNTIAYSASSVQLLYPVFFSIVKDLSVRGLFKKRNAIRTA